MDKTEDGRVKQWTREEVERLVPEEDLQRRAIALMPQARRETYSNWDLFEVILQTRLDLETANQTIQGLIGEIERVKKGWNKDHAEISRLREALGRIAKSEQAHCYGTDSEVNDLMQTRHDLRKCGDLAREALKEKS